MAILSVSELAQSIDKISLSSPKNAGKGGMKICTLKLDGRDVIVKLCDDLETITVPFEPSVFQGTGDETRKGIVFNVPDAIFDTFAAVEESCRQALESTVPNTNSIWSSSIRPSGSYPATLKAKINVTGDRAVKFYDVANEPAERPTNWQRLPCNAVLQVRGCYVQKQSVGLLLEVTHLQYGSELCDAERGSPF